MVRCRGSIRHHDAEGFWLDSDAGRGLEVQFAVDVDRQSGVGCQAESVGGQKRCFRQGVSSGQVLLLARSRRLPAWSPRCSRSRWALSAWSISWERLDLGGRPLCCTAHARVESLGWRADRGRVPGCPGWAGARQRRAFHQCLQPVRKVLPRVSHMSHMSHRPCAPYDVCGPPIDVRRTSVADLRHPLARARPHDAPERASEPGGSTGHRVSRWSERPQTVR